MKNLKISRIKMMLRSKQHKANKHHQQPQRPVKLAKGPTNKRRKIKEIAMKKGNKIRKDVDQGLMVLRRA